MPEAKVEGYCNYATFCVAVLLQNNDRDTFESWRARAKELQEDFPDEAQPEHKGQYSGVCIRLCNEIKDWIEEATPETLVEKDELMNSILSGLLNAAMGQVDWREVAEDFLSE